MAGRGRERFEKRQRERDRQRRAAAKRARREERKDTRDGPDDGAPEEVERSTDDLLEEFRVLSERHAAGHVAHDEFEARRAELLEALGVE